MGLRSSYYRQYALKIALEYAVFRRKYSKIFWWGDYSLAQASPPIVYQTENETTGYTLQVPTLVYSIAKADRYKQ